MVIYKIIDVVAHVVTAIIFIIERAACKLRVTVIFTKMLNTY